MIIELMIKIVFLSDTHSMHSKIKVPDGDILIHCGDFSGYGTEKDVIQFNAWLGTLPHKHKLVTPGNHDKFCEKYPEQAKALFTNAKLLIDEEITVEGLRIFMSPWTPQFFNWSYMYDRAYGKTVWEKIPEGIDVLVTHGAPFGILDHVMRPAMGNWEEESVGCSDLLHRVLDVKPKVHGFGHLHLKGGQIQVEAGTTFVNAAVCTEEYRPLNTIMVVEV